jgi:YihY family inner membrane protein
LTVNLIPVSREELSQQLASFSRNITFESVGLAGLAASVVLAFVMFNSLERIMNHVWRSERRRSLPQKFAIFYLSLTLVPVLIGVSLVEAARFGLTSGLTGALLGFSSTFLALLLANIFIPIPKVKLMPAVVGSLVTTVLFEVAKLGYSYYVGGFALDSYSGIYGAVAIFPLTLVWIYYSWMMLLLGVEIAHAVQNLRTLENIDRRSQMGLASEMMRRINGVVAARVMVAVAESFERGKKVLSRQAISDRFDLSDEVTSRLVDRLVEADLLMTVEGDLSGVAPARPPDKVYLAEVFRVFRGDDVDFDFDRPGRGQSPLDRVLKDIETSTQDKAMAHTLADLVPELEELEEHPGALADRVESVADEQDADPTGDP